MNDATANNPFSRIVADTRYVLLGPALTVPAFALVLTGLAAGIGSAVAIVGLFILVAALHVARGAAHVERIRLADLLGGPVVRRAYRPASPETGPLRRALAPLTCPQSWLDALHALMVLPLSLATFALTLTWWAAGVGGLLYPLWGWALYHVPGYTSVGSHVLPDSPVLATTLIHMLAGALFTLTAPAVARVSAGVQATVGRALLLAPSDDAVRVRTRPSGHVDEHDPVRHRVPTRA
ncbi:sensor domain-containing protein [Nocardiopsis sp. FIRDI 009]|uniref:sensor domain-containing protein n=1 Tax=Nocardiopsis sp. FIRDI 009 TaxID=714197 RepID=UPI000E280D43|nr:sensor domain-containing protein [Nocardiopsis sp. FIRDI 009]